MRVLYIPFFSNKHVEGCSVFNNMKVLLREMVERNTDMYLYYPLPQDPFDVGDAVEYLEHPRIHVFRVRAIPLQGEEISFLPETYVDLFHRIYGKYHFDVLISDKHFVSLWAHTLLNTNVRGCRAPSPIVNVMQYPILSEGRMECTPEFEASQVPNWLLGFNVFLSEADRELCIRVVRKWASGSALRLFLDRPYVTGTAAMDFDRIDRNYRERSREEVVFHYGSRVATHYGPVEILREAETLYRTGRPLRLVITSPASNASTLSVKELLAGFDAHGLPYEWKVPCPQQLFYQKAWGAHLSAFLIRQAGPMAVPREMAYMRVALAVPRLPLWDNLLPEYPWRFRTRDEMRVILAYLADHYWDDDVQTRLYAVSEDVRRRWGPDVFVDAFAALVRQAEGDTRREPAKQTVEITESILDGMGWPPELLLSDFEYGMRKFPKTPLRTMKGQAYRNRTRNEFVNALRNFGYRDTLDGPDMRLRLKGDDEWNHT